MTVNKILTVTLNPSIDQSASVKELHPDQKLKCSKLQYEPGGGGINVSRAIKKLGGISTAWFLAGGHHGAFFKEMIMQKGVPFEAFAIKNETRQSLILFEEQTSRQYMLDMEGPTIKEKEWQGMLNSVEATEGVEWLVASGSLPPGVPVDFFGRLAKIAKSKGIKLIIDTSGEALKIAIKEGVFMIKPNLRELKLLSGETSLDIDAAIDAAITLHQSQMETSIVVSLGADGAILVSKGIAQHIPAPKAELKSTVGAGDSMVAGIVYSLSMGKNWFQAAQYGVACGAAATMNAGTSLCKKEDADRLMLEMSQG